VKRGLRSRLRDGVRTLDLAARLLLGRRWWIAIPLPLVWLAWQALQLVVGWREEGFGPVDVQTVLVGMPLLVLAIGLGIRVIAGEMDRRTLEIAWTIPGGSHRMWLVKLAAAAFVLAAAELLLAVVVWAFFTEVTVGALWGAYQGALVYLALATWLAALFKSEATGAMASAAVLVFNGLFTGFGDAQRRLSPLFNPLAVDDIAVSDLVAWTVQNRVGWALGIAALVALALIRAERREVLLSG
jgi:hypothetical protein